VSDTVGTINVSAEKLEDLLHLAARKTKRPRKINFGVSSAQGTPDTSMRRLFLTERSSKMRFLVDTEADVSDLAVSFQNKRNRSKFTICAANSTPIAAFKQRLPQLDFRLRRNFLHSGSKQIHLRYGLFVALQPSDRYSDEED